MKVYESLEEIERDLKIYDLERKIAKEEAKAMGFQLRSKLVINPLLKKILRFAGRYGFMLILKKIIR
ncbi:hypothetical protein [Ascidiimonas aurantiaca]|uniref:hypothetical protein n=1 Tax=Ascidiimonas aurantiaca TaxID=1685432 RepID=UPI0030ECEE72